MRYARTTLRARKSMYRSGWQKEKAATEEVVVQCQRYFKAINSPIEKSEGRPNVGLYSALKYSLCSLSFRFLPSRRNSIL